MDRLNQELNSTPMRFTCSICAKGFSNGKSQARHISYCRKTRPHLKSRKKACVVCTKLKTRCDFTHPKCSRCVEKGIACGYSKSPQHFRETGAQDVPTPTLTQPVEPTTLLTTPSQDSVAAPLIEPYDESNNTEFAHVESFDNVTWDVEPEEIILDYSNDTTISEKTGQRLGSMSTSLELARSAYVLPDPFDSIFSPSITDTWSFDYIVPKAPRAFLSRQVGMHQLSLNRNYVACTLRSYPRMMLPGKVPPPFIHPHLLTHTDTKTHSGKSSPLAICVGIVQMFSVKSPANTIFIWRTIRMEQERLSAECARFDYWNTVAALQAITVYFLLRLSEDNEDATNFDLQLIRTMMKLALRMVEFKKNYTNPSDETSWEGWVVAESLRRTIIVLFLVDLLFDITSILYPYECNGNELANMTLPCSRNLWRATKKSDWEQEFRENKFTRKRLTYGDLLNFRFSNNDMLDSWLSQVDDLGLGIMNRSM